MMRIKPVIKISFGLVMVTVCLLLLGEFIGVIPNEERGLLEGRKKLSETLAVQFSMAVTSGNVGLVSATLNSLVERENDILSAALRTTGGNLVAVSGDHAQHWKGAPLDHSTSTQVQVPVFQGQERWGTVEITFTGIQAGGLPLGSFHSLVLLILYLTVFGFLANWLFIRRTLKELDPNAVIPERIRSAFNALAEGLVIMDEKGQIILANSSFARKMDFPEDRLLGRNMSRFNWITGNKRRRQDRLPWELSLESRSQQTGVALKYRTSKKDERVFMVNTSPILDAKSKVRGVMATFDDLTDLEEKQVELKQTITELEVSKEQLQEKTVELEYLATRDSLTGCLNRRAFFGKCEAHFEEARRTQSRVSCIMADIDHFKSINDRYGHAAGDKVIQLVANELRANARPDDIVGRYGGEEFCIILPGIGVEATMVIAERLRTAVKQSCQGRFTASMRITSSFGVAELEENISNPGDLVDRADKALYYAKENGRNRVACWSDVKDVVADAAEGRQNRQQLLDDQPKKTNNDCRESGQKATEREEEIRQLRDKVTELEEDLVHSHNELVQQAGRDPVTGLPGRLLFNDRITQALQRGERFDQIVAVIVLEIDMFQRINDALGLVVGDQLLKKAADRLTEVLRSTDTVSLLGSDAAGPTVSRTGTDEFGILLTDVKDTEMITWIAKRVLDSMAAALEIDGHEIFITCNAGVSLYPHDADQADALLENASAARYRAKQRLGKNNLQFYSADINQESYKQLWFESHLHHALEKDEFTLHYQPKVDLATGRITSLEALLRWNNEKLGAVSPVDFIPIAERTGLIVDIGKWVIASACSHARRWQEAGFGDVGVAVNLSVLQFRQKDLCEHIIEAIRVNELRSGSLELEITETAVMSNFSGAIQMLEHLHDAGVKLAVDDFGTGYSSLAYLKQLPVNTLKIDRSFLSDSIPDQQDMLIIKAIIAMAHSMGLRVVAEGVETHAQTAFLQRLDCDEMQGYLVSKPVEVQEAMKLLHKYNRENMKTIGETIPA